MDQLVLPKPQTGFLGGSRVRNPPAKAGDAGDAGLTLESRRSLLGKEMATYCSIFAWRILWTEEPGRLQSMGSQRVRHN